MNVAALPYRSMSSLDKISDRLFRGYLLFVSCISFGELALRGWGVSTSGNYALNSLAIGWFLACLSFSLRYHFSTHWLFLSVLVVFKVGDFLDVFYLERAEQVFLLRSLWMVAVPVLCAFFLRRCWVVPVSVANGVLFLGTRMVRVAHHPNCGGVSCVTFFYTTAAAYTMFTLGAYYFRRLLERSEAQRQAVEAEQQSLLSRHQALSRAVIHDVNNAVMVVNWNFSTCEKQFRNGGSLQTFKSSLDSLVELTRGLTSLIKGEHTQKRLAQIRVSQLFDTLRSSYSELFDRRQISLAFESRDDWVFRSDPALLAHSIFGNLLMNALKFLQPSNTVTLSALDHDDRYLHFDLRDNGPGIPREIVQKVQKGFGSVESRPGTTGETGSGKGLGLVKYFVTELGGEFRIKDCAQTGTWLRVSVPKD
jgi:signal transduction histidine kinase